MDPYPSLTPSAFFSPSKAAAQRAQAKDWHFVDTWLTSHRLGGVPFERNDVTLKALLALLAANERADEERELVWAVEAEAAEELREKATEPDWIATLLLDVADSLDPKPRQTLDSLASLTVQYDAPGPDAESLAHAILANSMPPAHAPSAAATLFPAFATTTASRFDGAASRLPAPADERAADTLELARHTKMLRAKIAEYGERVGAGAGTRGGADGGVVERVVAREGEIERLKGEVARLGREEEAYGGLPAEVEEARREVGRMEEELARLRARREELFERMVR